MVSSTRELALAGSAVDGCRTLLPTSTNIGRRVYDLRFSFKYASYVGKVLTTVVLSIWRQAST